MGGPGGLNWGAKTGHGSSTQEGQSAEHCFPCRFACRFACLRPQLLPKLVGERIVCVCMVERPRGKGGGLVGIGPLVKL